MSLEEKIFYVMFFFPAPFPFNFCNSFSFSLQLHICAAFVKRKKNFYFISRIESWSIKVGWRNKS